MDVLVAGVLSCVVAGVAVAAREALRQHLDTPFAAGSAA